MKKLLPCFSESSKASTMVLHFQHMLFKVIMDRTNQSIKEQIKTHQHVSFSHFYAFYPVFHADHPSVAYKNQHPQWSSRNCLLSTVDLKRGDELHNFFRSQKVLDSVILGNKHFSCELKFYKYILRKICVWLSFHFLRCSHVFSAV